MNIENKLNIEVQHDATKIKMAVLGSPRMILYISYQLYLNKNSRRKKITPSINGRFKSGAVLPLVSGEQEFKLVQKFYKESTK